ncbi:MAG: orotidine-5'-phosphate decarboxylase [Pseudomonadota bacterium]
MRNIPTDRRLIVALDVPNPASARTLVKQIGGDVGFYKVGLELVMAGGLDLVRGLRDDGFDVFLDMKLLDIGNTVMRAVARAAETGATFLTIHGIDAKTAEAAVAGRADRSLRLLGVTVLTSLDADDLAEQGIAEPIDDLVVRRAGLCVGAGVDGVVASPNEAARVRATVGAAPLIVTPGIRRADNDAGDQTRIATPTAALNSGADYLVVGRPITQAGDPQAAARAFQTEIARAVEQNDQARPSDSAK